MDFYNFGEDGDRLLRPSQTLPEPNTPESESYLRNYLKQYICDVEKVARAQNILVVEEDTRIQRVLQNLIQEENRTASCAFRDTVDDFLELQKSYAFDLVIVNYYLAEDEVDYDFWEQVRNEYPSLEVIILSHVNDREYYQMLEKIETDEMAAARATDLTAPLGTMTTKMKTFFENIFGGRNGNQ